MASKVQVNFHLIFSQAEHSGLSRRCNTVYVFGTVQGCAGSIRV